jgi:hypothetical protein
VLKNGEGYLKQMAAYRVELHKRWPKMNLTMGKACGTCSGRLDFC